MNIAAAGWSPNVDVTFLEPICMYAKGGGGVHRIIKVLLKFDVGLYRVSIKKCNISIFGSKW